MSPVDRTQSGSVSSTQFVDKLTTGNADLEQGLVLLAHVRQLGVDDSSSLNRVEAAACAIAEICKLRIVDDLDESGVAALVNQVNRLDNSGASLVRMRVEDHDQVATERAAFGALSDVLGKTSEIQTRHTERGVRNLSGEQLRRYGVLSTLAPLEVSTDSWARTTSSFSTLRDDRPVPIERHFGLSLGDHIDQIYEDATRPDSLLVWHYDSEDKRVFRFEEEGFKEVSYDEKLGQWISK